MATIPSYELIDDLLAAVAEKSRTAREERYEKEQADLRAEAERKAREEAEAAKNRAEKLIEFMTFDLRDKLRTIGRLNLLDDDESKKRDRVYFDSFAGEDDNRPKSSGSEASCIGNQGDVLRAQGDLPW